jgi:hypothetical protein
LQIGDYCRQIESYLCQKNDGHLIRIAGPSFDRVSAWASRGIPVKLVYQGIDRYFQRYYSKGPRRRPVRIDFCEADVLDVFDEWRRATGVVWEAAGRDDGAAGVAGRRESDADSGDGARRPPSLTAHVERVLRRLTSARASGALDAGFDDLLDRVSHEHEAARGARGTRRQAIVERLAALDRELIERSRARLDESVVTALRREAGEELATFRSGMTAEAFGRARDAALERLIRERAGLPTIRYS